MVQFFTFWGTAALRNPNARTNGKDFMSKMFGWMLPKGRNRVKLSKMNMGGMGTAMMKGLMKKKNAPSLDQLFDTGRPARRPDQSLRNVHGSHGLQA